AIDPAGRPEFVVRQRCADRRWGNVEERAHHAARGNAGSVIRKGPRQEKRIVHINAIRRRSPDPWPRSRRAFDLDVFRCPRCADRMELLATIDDPAVALAPGAASVRVWQITSRAGGHPAARPPPERANLAYALTPFRRRSLPSP